MGAALATDRILGLFDLRSQDHTRHSITLRGHPIVGVAFEHRSALMWPSSASIVDSETPRLSSTEKNLHIVTSFLRYFDPYTNKSVACVGYRKLVQQSGHFCCALRGWRMQVHTACETPAANRMAAYRLVVRPGRFANRLIQYREHAVENQMGNQGGGIAWRRVISRGGTQCGERASSAGSGGAPR
jgi:hypothetical protein